MHSCKPIPVFVINLKSREDRKKHIQKEFEDRGEFSINIVDACKHKIGAVSLWNSIKNIIKNLVSEEDEYIIICEDDHQFTEYYTREYLSTCIQATKETEADLLLGGVSWFRDAIRITGNIYRVEQFSGLQFTIIFRRFFDKIIGAPFGDTDAADYKMASLSNNKLFLYPFISIQKDFGYSDVTAKNNSECRVEELFRHSSERLVHLNSVESYYQALKDRKGNDIEIIDIQGITIPTYVINLPERTDRLEHVRSQFLGRSEFDVNIIEACRHEVGAVGLWNSIKKIVERAVDKDDDVIIICEDDHEFTIDYSKEYLLNNVIEAHNQGVEILSGGIGGFGQIVPVTNNRYWIDSFWCTQFIVLYKKVFKKIIAEPFAERDTADGILSELTSHKMVLHPFVSIQKEFGYSDVTKSNNANEGMITRHFKTANERLCFYKKIFESA